MSLDSDLRQSFVALRRRLGYAAAIVGTIALGVGLNTAAFSLLNRVLFSPLPFEDSRQLVWVWESNPAENLEEFAVSLRNFVDWRDQASSFSAMAAYGLGYVTLTELGEARSVPAAEVSEDFFSLLGVEPVAGRGFAAEHFQPGNDRVVLLTHGLRQSLFGDGTDILGRQLRLGGEVYQVIGVLPPGFDFLGQEADLWSPMALDPASLPHRGAHNRSAIARLAPGVSLARAQEEMSAIAARLAREYPDTNGGFGVDLVPLKERLVGDFTTSFWVLAGAVALVLLIACANVSNLLLVRALERRREIAIRQAFGVSRVRLVGHLLTENAILALIGGIAGLGLATIGIRLIQVFGPREIPRLETVRLDAPALTFALGVTLLTLLVVSLAPAIRALRLDIRSWLADGGSRGASEGLAGRRLRNTFVVVELALSFVLLGAALLLAQTYRSLQKVEIGLDPESVLQARIQMPRKAYPEDPQQLAFTEALLQRLASLPGVESAAMSQALPTTEWYTEAKLPGRPPEDAYEALFRSVTPEYFQTLSIPLVEGRWFQPADDLRAPAVAIINRAAARGMYPDGKPIGRRLQLPGDDRWFEVVGVIGDVRQLGPAAEPIPEIYVAARQEPRRRYYLLARTTGDPMAAVPEIRAALNQLDRQIPLQRPQRLAEQFTTTVATPRLSMILFSWFSILALLLASIGIYGVIRYSVEQRTQEIGTRMALGARGEDVRRQILAEGLKLVLGGVVIGAALALYFNRMLASLLFEIGPWDVVTLAIVAASLAVISMVATYLPARHAARLEPIEAIREH